MEEYMKDELELLLEKNNITYQEKPKLFYSLSYCQGDGAMFEGAFEWEGNEYIVKHSGHYYHENSKTIDSDTGNEEEFNDLYVDICRELAKVGYEYIDDVTSDENIKEGIDANDYEFLQDGTIFS